MRKWTFALLVLLLSTEPAAAQPKPIPVPPEFQKILGPSKFDPDRLREAIAFPIGRVLLGIGVKQSNKDEELPIAVIEKKLVGDERDAEWLIKLGRALKDAKSDGATKAYEKAAAALRKRIEKEPKNGELYLQLGEALEEVHGFDAGFPLARKCVEGDPTHHRGRGALGSHYWMQFLRHVYGDKEKINWEVRSNKPPSTDIRAMTDAEKGKARTLLKYISHCEKERDRHTPEDVNSVMVNVLMEGHRALFDSYFRTGQWDVEAAAYPRFLSGRVVAAYAKHGREKQDPGAYGLAAMAQMAAFAREATERDWSFARMTPAQKKIVAELTDPLEKLAENKDRATATKATFILAMLAMMEEDVASTTRYAEKAFVLAPCEKAVIDMNAMLVKEEGKLDYEKFLLSHAAKHPSTRVWELLAVYHFRAKRFDEAERYLREAEKLEPQARRWQMARAAILLKRGAGTLREAGKILDALEKRLDEKEEDKCLIVVEDIPKFQEGYRYLRALYTALSGKWEQGRDELAELREREVMVDEIGPALEAFPRRPVILPVQRLEPALPR